MSIEEWRAIPGWEGCYEASSMGRIRSLVRGGKHRQYGGGEIQPIPTSNGYLCVNLKKIGTRKQYTVHRLVLLAFRGAPPLSSDGCHQNGNRQDNRIENLRWDTRKANIADKVLHGTQQIGERNGNAKVTADIVRQMRESTKSIREIALEFCVSETSAASICKGKSWKHVR